MPEETYIGDGVYASLSGGMIRLRTARDDLSGDHVIYLEPEVYQALRKFAKKIWFESEPEKP